MGGHHPQAAVQAPAVVSARELPAQVQVSPSPNGMAQPVSSRNATITPAVTVRNAPLGPLPEPEAVSPEPEPTSSAAPAASAPPVANLTLAEEVAILDEARRALAQGRGAEAIAVLDRYAREVPRGRLGHEAAFVRMQALVQTGNQAAADQLADQFLQANPGSPLAPRVRALRNR